MNVFLHSKSQIMMMNPILDINISFSMVLQQEHEMMSSNSYSASEATYESTMPMQVNSTQCNSHDKGGSYKGKGQGFPKGESILYSLW